MSCKHNDPCKCTKMKIEALEKHIHLMTQAHYWEEVRRTGGALRDISRCGCRCHC